MIFFFCYPSIDNHWCVCATNERDGKSFLALCVKREKICGNFQHLQGKKSQLHPRSSMLKQFSFFCVAKIYFFCFHNSRKKKIFLHIERMRYIRDGLVSSVKWKYLWNKWHMRMEENIKFLLDHQCWFICAGNLRWERIKNFVKREIFGENCRKSENLIKCKIKN